WTGEQRGFAVTAYLENGLSYIRAQHSFDLNFHLPPRACPPSKKVIYVWAKIFRATGKQRLFYMGISEVEVIFFRLA
ncbi:hypothetical protein C0J52_19538, partial [Blattella germanica]